MLPTLPPGMGSVTDEARQEWNGARRAAFWVRMRANLGAKVPMALDFNDVSHRLKLRNAVYRGSQMIPLKQIVGSLGRYQDFTRTFLPVRGNLSARWRAVAVVALEMGSRGLPPIEVYKAREWYFVRDGNHRVSVANQMKQTTIEAYVWEYTDCLPEVESGAGIESLLIEAERREFFDQTHLDTLCPNNDIRVNAPGGYTDLLVMIANYQVALEKIDGVAPSYEDTVKMWYEMIYETSVQLIKDSGVLDLFPQSSAADLFVWVSKHQRELEQRYQGQMWMVDAAKAYRWHNPRSPLEFAFAWLRWQSNRLLRVMFVSTRRPREHENPINNRQA